MEQSAYSCRQGHRYAVVQDIPILLRDDVVANHRAFDESRATATNGVSAEGSAPPSGVIDPFVQGEIINTNGNLYRGLLGKLTRYPIPRFPMSDGGGRRVLDIGCNWGRWCIAAQRVGFQATGIDPNLKAVEAARRVSRQLGASPEFLVADGRNLPFPMDTFDVVFSYSVLQHFSRPDVEATLRQAERVLKPGGTMLIQMANVLGLRQMYNQIVDLTHGENGIFRVRRWLPWQLLSAFRENVGPATLTPDGFFTLNPQVSDVDLLPPFPRLVVSASVALCRVSAKFRPLRYFADSLFIEAHKPG
ncbi:MAG: class I SAM-dependent methyltransferase [Polyangia bacterium]